MRIARTHVWSAAWYLGIVLSVTLPWFLKPGYLFFTDFAFGPYAPVRWTQSGAPVTALLRAAALVVPADVAQKLFFAALVGALLLAGERLARAFVDDRWLARVASLFFVFNPFVYDRLGYGQVGMALGLACVTLACAELARAERPDAWGRFVRAGVWFGLAVQASPHYAFIGALLAAAFAGAALARPAFRSARFAAACVTVCAVALLANANWMAHADRDGGTALPEATVENAAAFQTSGDTGLGALGNVAMLSGFWGKDQGRYDDLSAFRENWGRSFALLAALMAGGVLAAARDPRRRALCLALGAAACVAAALAVGVRLPGTREATQWMFAHVPGYRGMRETQKWAAALVVAYGTFVAWGLERLLRAPRVRDHRRAALAATAAVIVLYAPLLLWGLNGSVRPVAYPADWEARSAALAESGCPGRTLFLPWHMYMGFSWIGRVVANPAESAFPCWVIRGTNMEWNGIYDNSGSATGATVDAWIRARGEPTAAFDALDVRRILLAKDADWERYDWLADRPEWTLASDTATLRVYERAP